MQTIKIKHKLSRFAFINELDFRQNEDELFEELPEIEVKKTKKKHELSYPDSPLSE